MEGTATPSPSFPLTVLSTHCPDFQKTGRAIMTLSSNLSPRCQKRKGSRGHNSQKPLSHRPERCVLFRDGRGQS